MKKVMIWIVTIFTATVVLSPLTAGSASAATGPFDTICATGQNVNTSTVCQSKGSTSNPLIGPDGIITRVIQLINFAIAVVAVFVIMISGIRFVVSQGDANTISGARNAILYSVVGLFVAITAQLIVEFVLKKL